ARQSRKRVRDFGEVEANRQVVTRRLGILEGKSGVPLGLICEPLQEQCSGQIAVSRKSLIKANPHHMALIALSDVVVQEPHEVVPGFPLAALTMERCAQETIADKDIIRIPRVTCSLRKALSEFAADLMFAAFDPIVPHAPEGPELHFRIAEPLGDLECLR